jgi:ABC-type lipoprotein export system ATPase subunit
MLLRLQNITKGYGIPGTQSYRPVLDNLNLELNEGEKTAIIGQSGSGKTTLLNLIGTLDKPDSGTIHFDGKNLSGFTNPELARFRNQKIGFVFQLHHLLPQLTLIENVLLPILAVNKKVTRQQIEWAEYLIQKVGIWEQRNQKPSQMSGGECQRTAVVRALINKPVLLLADEPTGALDEKNAGHLTELLIRLSNEEKTTLLVVTHSSGLSEKMDRILTLKDKKL